MSPRKALDKTVPNSALETLSFGLNFVTQTHIRPSSQDVLI
ncbi:MAG: hypothetical protein WCG25_07335 [bacterium]